MRVHHTPADPTPAKPHRASVYLLQRLDRQRFKIGWASDPMKRVLQLPEFNRRELDLGRSSLLWLPSESRAQQVEHSLHKSLWPYQADVGHRGDGHTEWFESAAHSLAVRLLRQMPFQAGANQRSWLVPLVDAFNQADRQADSVADQALGGCAPIDTWWAIEDLWTRLASFMPMRVDNERDVFRVVLPRFRGTGDALGLRMAVLDLDTYRWATPDGAGSFVRFIDYDANDLVLQMPSIRQIERWPDSDDLVWQVKGFLLRLKRMAQASAVQARQARQT
jgi:hypothetical protein